MVLGGSHDVTAQVPLDQAAPMRYVL